MGFPSNKNDRNNINKGFGNPTPEDEKSNAKGKQEKVIGAIKGRITTSKSSVKSLNTGVKTSR